MQSGQRFGLHGFKVTVRETIRRSHSYRQTQRTSNALLDVHLMF